MDYFLQSRQHFELFVWMVLLIGSAIGAAAVLVAMVLDGKTHQAVRLSAIALALAALTAATVSASTPLANYCNGLEPYSFWWWAGGCWGLP